MTPMQGILSQRRPLMMQRIEVLVRSRSTGNDLVHHPVGRQEYWRWVACFGFGTEASDPIHSTTLARRCRWAFFVESSLALRRSPATWRTESWKSCWKLDGRAATGKRGMPIHPWDPHAHRRRSGRGVSSVRMNDFGFGLLWYEGIL